MTQLEKDILAFTIITLLMLTPVVAFILKVCEG